MTDSPAPEQPVHEQAALEQPAPARSPRMLAWLRLRRNSAAMISLAIIIAVCVGCFGAPLFTSHDPGYQRQWIGAQPPGFSHPAVPATTTLATGEQPNLPDLPAGAQTLTLTVDASDYREYRLVPTKDLSLRAIVESVGSKQHDQLVIAPSQSARPQLAGGGRGPAIEPQTLTVGQATGLFTAYENILLMVSDNPQTLTYSAELAADGSVQRIQRQTGDSTATITGAQLIEITGRDVLTLTADGKPITLSHVLGTDDAGRDVLARILYGGRISLLVGIVATFVSLVIGVLYGALSGFLGGRSDRLMMAGVDILFGLPFMFLVIVLLSFFQRNILLLFVALGAVQWLTMARIVRGQVLSLRHREFIYAAELAGTKPFAILRQHLIPNCAGSIIVYASLTVPVVILEESFLAFIGLSASMGDGQVHSWGALIKDGMSALGNDGSRSWLLIWPSLTMGATLLALNLLGDGLRDALDPKLAGRSP